MSLKNEISETINDIELHVKTGEIEEAKKILSTLENIPDITQKIEQLHIECKYVLLLQGAYERDDFRACYEILDLHSSLKSTQLGELLEKHWSKIMQKCEEFALRGNIKDIKKTLGTLIDLPSRDNKIGDLLRVSFHVRVSTLLDKKEYKGAEAIIYTYIDIFGHDNEIDTLMKKFEKKSRRKLAITQFQKRPTRESWRESDIIMK